MSDQFELDPRRLEAFKLKVNSLIDSYLSQKPTPRINEFAEVFYAEEYVTRLKRQNAVMINVKEFKAEIVKRLLEQSKSSGAEVLLPFKFEMLLSTILPPGEGELKAGNGEGFEKKKYIPRTQYFIDLLSKMGEPYEIIGGKNTSEMVRERTYFIFYIATLQKAVFVNNEEGNTTFIIYDIASKQEVVELSLLKKDDIIGKKRHAHPVAQVDWTGDEESWKGKIFERLTHAISDSEQKETELFLPELAPEGWMTIPQIALEVKRSKEWVVPRVADLKVQNETLSPKEYIGSNKRRWWHYPPKMIEELKKIAEKEKVAPEGWATIYGIAKKINKSRPWVESHLTDIIGKRPEWETQTYSVEGGRELPHYPPEAIAELEKMYEKLSKAPDGWLSIHGIVSLIKDRSREWVEPRVQEYVKTHYEWSPKPYIDAGNVPVSYYPPELVAGILAESKTLEKAPDGWLPSSSVEERIGKSRSWIEKRLKKLREKNPKLETHDYVDQSGHASLHYSAELVTTLAQEANLVERAPEGWLTLKQMSKTIGKNRSWVMQHLDIIKSEHPEWKIRNYLDKRGIEFSHYAPEYAVELRKILDRENRSKI